ncbi:MAG: hypothetical protein AAGA60_19590 [Cyanobacteria bacterium P01_E01_bin.42]
MATATSVRVGDLATPVKKKRSRQHFRHQLKVLTICNTDRLLRIRVQHIIENNFKER